MKLKVRTDSKRFVELLRYYKETKDELDFFLTIKMVDEGIADGTGPWLSCCLPDSNDVYIRYSDDVYRSPGAALDAVYRLNELME